MLIGRQQREGDSGSVWKFLVDPYFPIVVTDDLLANRKPDSGAFKFIVAQLARR